MSMPAQQQRVRAESIDVEAQMAAGRPDDPAVTSRSGSVFGRFFRRLRNFSSQTASRRTSLSSSARRSDGHERDSSRNSRSDSIITPMAQQNLNYQAQGAPAAAPRRLRPACAIRTYNTQSIVLPVNLRRSTVAIDKGPEADKVNLVAIMDTNCRAILRVYGQGGQLLAEANFESGLEQDVYVVFEKPAKHVQSGIEVRLSMLRGKGKTSPSDVMLATEQITRISINPEGSSARLDTKIIEQFVMVNGKRYNLLEIYGQATQVAKGNGIGGDHASIDSEISQSSFEKINDDNRECIACLTDLRDTVVLPCRHMCLCASCAESLRGRADKCPLCRQGFKALLQIVQKEYTMQQ